MDHITDEAIIEEVKRRKLIHPDIVDGWQKARKIKQLEETIEKSQKELELIKAGEK
jgi:hypothetical protein